MPEIAVIVFAIGALGGLYMATRIFRGKFAPWAVSILHALAGATGILLLLWAVLTRVTGPWLTASLGLFVLAALGGFFLASFHLRKELPPRAFVLGHGTVAVTAFVLLLIAVFAPGAG
jgi:hypothetical protein